MAFLSPLEKLEKTHQKVTHTDVQSKINEKEIIIRLLPFFPYSVDEDDVVRLADGNLSRVWREGHVFDHVALLSILQQRVVLLGYITAYHSLPRPYYIRPCMYIPL